MYFIQFKNSSKFNNSKEQYNKVNYYEHKVLYRLNMSMVFKKLQNKILVHMKTFDKPHIRVLDHLLGREKHLSVSFPNSLYIGVLVHQNFVLVLVSVASHLNNITLVWAKTIVKRYYLILRLHLLTIHQKLGKIKVIT